MRECLWLAVAEAVGITGLIVWRWHVEQLPRSRDVVGAPAVGEQTVVADAVETVRQDMDEEAAASHLGDHHARGPAYSRSSSRQMPSRNRERLLRWGLPSA